MRPSVTPGTQAQLRKLIQPDFFHLTDQEQLHVLAVAIVQAEKFRLTRELLLAARWEIRSRQPNPIALPVIRRTVTTGAV